jgi:hypothetical protein
VKDRPTTAPLPPYGIESGPTTASIHETRHTKSPKRLPEKSILFAAQTPAGSYNKISGDEAKMYRYEGRNLMAGKRRSYPQHPAIAHVSHIQHVTNASPEVAATAAPSADEIPYASGGRVRPNSHRYFEETRASRAVSHVQPSWWG